MAVLKEESKQEKFFRSLKEQYLLLRRKSTNILKRISNSKLNSGDPYTIQSRPSNSRNHSDYYIADPILQYSLGNPSFTSVRTLYKDLEKQIYIYIGIVGAADNSIGLLQTDVPIDQILASPQGNDAITQILQAEYAAKQVKDSWEEQQVEFDEKTPNIFRPSFNLGQISSKNNYFEVSPETSPEIQKILETENTKKDAIENRISENNVVKKLGDYAIANTYISRVPAEKFNETYQGVNLDSISYTYSHLKLLSNSNGEYIYSGKVTTGNGVKTERTSNSTIAFNSTDIIYDNVIITLPKPIATIVIEHQYRIEDAFATAFCDTILEQKKDVTDSDIPFIYAGKISQPDEYTVYSIDLDDTIKPETLKLLPTEKKKTTSNTIAFPGDRTVSDSHDEK